MWPLNVQYLFYDPPFSQVLLHTSGNTNCMQALCCLAEIIVRCQRNLVTGRQINCMGRVRLRCRDRRTEYSATNESVGLGELDAKKWGRASTRQHGITFQTLFMVSAMAASNKEAKISIYLCYFGIEFYRGSEKPCSNSCTVMFMIKTVSINWVFQISWTLKYSVRITDW